MKELHLHIHVVLILLFVIISSIIIITTTVTITSARPLEERKSSGGVGLPPIPSVASVCIHNQVNQDMIDNNNYNDNVQQQQSPSSSSQQNSRRTNSYSLQPFSVQVEYYLAPNDTQACTSAKVAAGTSVTIIPGRQTKVCASNDVLTAEKETFVRTNIAAAIQRFADILTIPEGTSSAWNLGSSLTICGAYGGVPIPDRYKTGGSGTTSQLLLFVTTRPAPSDMTIAYAVYCARDSGTNRPIAGQINIAPALIDISSDAHAEQLGVYIHELTHVLVFSTSHFPFFRNGNNVNYITNVGTKSYITTPIVIANARDHFGCANLTGGELEDDGGSGTKGTHWEKKSYNNEYITGTSSYSPLLSNISLALFADSGWYNVNFDKAEKLYWGYKQGCSFTQQSCSSWLNTIPFPQATFCLDPSGPTGLVTCTYDRQSIGFCGVVEYANGVIPAQDRYFTGDPNLGGYDALAEYCPSVVPAQGLSCTNPDDAQDNDGKQGASRCPECRCYISDLFSGTYGGSRSYNASCYDTLCVNSTALKINIDGIWYDCPSGGYIPADKVVGFSGQNVTCPTAVALICEGYQDERHLWPEFKLNINSLTPGFTIPDVLDPAGGESITIRGINFMYNGEAYVQTVILGGAELDDLVVINNTFLTGTTRPKQSGSDLQLIPIDSNVTRQDNNKKITRQTGTKNSANFQNKSAYSSAVRKAQLFAANALRAIANFMSSYWWLPFLTGGVLLLLILTCLRKFCIPEKKTKLRTKKLNKVAPESTPRSTMLR